MEMQEAIGFAPREGLEVEGDEPPAMRSGEAAGPPGSALNPRSANFQDVVILSIGAALLRRF